MASIKITDSISAELIAANPQANSGFAKYLKAAAASLLAGSDFTAQFKKDLVLVNPGESGFALKWGSDVPVGKDTASLKISAGSAALLTVYNRTGMLLLDDAFVGPEIKVPAGQAFVAFLLRPTIKAEGAATLGALSFGLELGTEVEWRFYQPFDLTGPPITLGHACQTLFETVSIPDSVDDLKAMANRPAGTMTTVSGHGHLQIGCSVNVAAAVNPLASVSTIGKIGPLSVSGAAAAEIGVEATISGDFQIRVQTLEDRKVRLGYHKMAAREVGITLEASAGPGVTIGDRDLLGMLFGKPTSTGTIEEALTESGVTKEQLDKITTAMRNGLSRKLLLELGASFSSLKQNDAAFLYEIDLDALDAEGAAAIDKALSGDLGDLNRLEPTLPGHGITLQQSRTSHLRTRQVAWRVNVIGLVNVLSLKELAVEATVVHDADSGELLMTDAATSQKVKAITSRKDLHKLLFESLMLTVTYKASGLDQNTGVTAATSYFKMDNDVNRHEMADFLDAVAAVGLMPAHDIDAQLGQVDDFDRGSLLIDITFDQASCELMFIDADTPRDRDFYEDVGKLALLALVQEDDADAYRRIPLTKGALWQKMRNNTSSDFRFLLRPFLPAASEDAEKLHAGVVTADYMMIVWWAGTMATAAQKLSEMRTFLSGPPPVVPSDTNKAFNKRRKALREAMVDVILKSPSTFGGDPWGLVALFYASQRSAPVTAMVVSPRLTLFLP